MDISTRITRVCGQIHPIGTVIIHVTTSGCNGRGENTIYYTRGQIIELTGRRKRERFEDGRPKVPGYPLNKLRTVIIEEIWLPLPLKDHKFQFEGEMKKLHDGLKLVGRVVTAVLIPTRPDLMEVARTGRDARGYQGTCNRWVVDHLQEGNVVVADMSDRVWNGISVGGGLTTAIDARTRTGGAVVWGGMRDIEQMQKINTQVYYRGTNPTPIRECLVTSYSRPARIGKVVCMSSDIVMGITSGILLIPAYLMEELVNSVEKSHTKDIFGFVMLEQETYSATEVDSTAWPEETVDKMIDLIEYGSSREKYKRLDWSLEISATRGDQGAMDELMGGYPV